MIRGRKKMDIQGTLVKRNYYIEEKMVRGLSILSAITHKELSLLINEAIMDLLIKHQSETNVPLLDIKEIS
jgi:hypothetical protein